MLSFLLLLGTITSDATKLTSEQIAKITQHEAADMWAERADKTFDVRTIRQQNGQALAELLESTHACQMVISNVEDYVAHFEAEMVRTAKPNAEWFEEYVS